MKQLTLDMLRKRTVRTGPSIMSPPAVAPDEGTPVRPRRTRHAPRTKVILTHAGTGTGIVREALAHLGAECRVLTGLDHAYTMDFDGILLLGGADINPRWYGERVTHTRYLDKERDAIEWTLARRALAQDKPIFGICRGHQMLAAAAGGALYQDIIEEGASTQDHQGRGHEVEQLHPLLAERIPTTRVNSLHHQAVKSVPGGFEVAAQAPDGIIEAIYRPGALGVQFHPELLVERERGWLELFRWFLDGLR